MPRGANAKPNHPPSRRALVLLLAESRSFVLLGLVCLVLALVFAVRYTPLGPAELVVGKVEAVTVVASGKYSNGQLVTVGLGADTVLVHGLPRDCGVGDPILIRRQRMLWGASLTAVSCGSAAPNTVEQDRAWPRGADSAVTATGDGA